eukprot:817478_1
MGGDDVSNDNKDGEIKRKAKDIQQNTIQELAITKGKSETKTQAKGTRLPRQMNQGEIGEDEEDSDEDLYSNEGVKKVTTIGSTQTTPNCLEVSLSSTSKQTTQNPCTDQGNDT